MVRMKRWIAVLVAVVCVSSKGADCTVTGRDGVFNHQTIGMGLTTSDVGKGTPAVQMPSPAACVRACPDGAASPKRLWNDISPLVKEWELGKRAETLAWFEENQFGKTPCGRLPDEVIGASSVSFTNAGLRIEICCRLPVGADVRKGCHDLVIENISGSTGDDAVALTAYRDPIGSPARYGMQIGGNSDLGERDDVYNVTIRNVKARSAGGHGVIRLLTCDGIRMHHISVSNVVDTATGDQKRPQATIRIGDRMFHKTRRCEMGEMHHVSVRNVTASGKVAVWIKGPLCDSEVVSIEETPGGKKYDITAPVENVALDK